jgi:hypothetical protein
LRSWAFVPKPFGSGKSGGQSFEIRGLIQAFLEKGQEKNGKLGATGEFGYEVPVKRGTSTDVTDAVGENPGLRKGFGQRPGCKSVQSIAERFHFAGEKFAADAVGDHVLDMDADLLADAGHEFHGFLYR